MYNTSKDLRIDCELLISRQHLTCANHVL